MVIQSGMINDILDSLSKRKVDSVVKLNVGGGNVLQLNGNVILRSNFRLQLNVKLTIGALWDFL
jgi:hypothetical protein